MRVRWLQSAFAALVVVGVIAVPALALRPASLPTELPPAPDVHAVKPADPQRVDDDGAGSCHGIQRAFWAVTNNPGRGEGKQAAAEDLRAHAAERACELSGEAFEGWPGGGPPPWAGQDTDDNGNGRRRPPWASEGDGPPWGPPPWTRGAADESEADEQQ